MQAACRGALSEARFLWEALSRSWEVCQPFTQALPFDFVMRFEPTSDWLTVQCKTAFYCSHAKQYVVRVRRSQNKSYQLYDYDALCIIVPGKDCYLIPFREVSHVGYSLQVKNFEQFSLSLIDPKEFQSKILRFQETSP